MRLRSLFCIAAFLALAAPSYAQYGGFGGPSILSRGGGSPGRTGENPISFSAFAGITGSYSTRFNTKGQEQGSPIQNGDTFGGAVSAGFSGYKVGRRSATSAALVASYGRYDGGLGPTDTTSGSMQLTHSRQLNRRTSWYLGFSGTTSNNAVTRGGYQSIGQFTEEPTAQTPLLQEDYFDNRVYTGTLATGFTYEQTSRLTFSVQGGAFGTERRAKEYQDARGFQAGGAAQYTLNRRTYTGVQYTYGTYYFPGRYGESQYMTAQGFIGRTLSRRWTAQAGAGPLWVKSTRVQSVAIDPFIASLTGQATADEIVNRDNRTMSMFGMVAGRFSKSSLSLTFSRGIVPGSAIYQTALTDRADLSYYYNLARSVSVGANIGYGQTKAYLQDNLAASRIFNAGVSASYRISETMSLATSAGVFRSRIAGQLLHSDQFMASIGLYYSPGELPFTIF